MATTVVNISGAVGRLRLKRNEIARRFQTGILKAGRLLLQQSQEVVPIDTKRLYESSRAYVKSGGGFSTVVWVSYATPYAVIVHESRYYAHGRAFNIKNARKIKAGLEKSRRPQEQWKFLEMPLRRDLDKLIQVIVVEMRR